MNNLNDPIRIRTRDVPACSAVFYRVPLLIRNVVVNLNEIFSVQNEEHFINT